MTEGGPKQSHHALALENEVALEKSLIPKGRENKASRDLSEVAQGADFKESREPNLCPLL
jgi:hypothetical protein